MGSHRQGQPNLRFSEIVEIGLHNVEALSCEPRQDACTAVGRAGVEGHRSAVRVESPLSGKGTTISSVPPGLNRRLNWATTGLAVYDRLLL